MEGHGPYDQEKRKKTLVEGVSRNCVFLCVSQWCSIEGTKKG